MSCSITHAIRALTQEFKLHREMNELHHKENLEYFRNRDSAPGPQGGGGPPKPNHEGSIPSPGAIAGPLRIHSAGPRYRSVHGPNMCALCPRQGDDYDCFIASCPGSAPCYNCNCLACTEERMP